MLRRFWETLGRCWEGLEGVWMGIHWSSRGPWMVVSTVQRRFCIDSLGSKLIIRRPLLDMEYEWSSILCFLRLVLANRLLGLGLDRCQAYVIMQSVWLLAGDLLVPLTTLFCNTRSYGTLFIEAWFNYNRTLFIRSDSFNSCLYE